MRNWIITIIVLAAALVLGAWIERARGAEPGVAEQDYAVYLAKTEVRRIARTVSPRAEPVCWLAAQQLNLGLQERKRLAWLSDAEFRAIVLRLHRELPRRCPLHFPPLR